MNAPHDRTEASTRPSTTHEEVAVKRLSAMRSESALWRMAGSLVGGQGATAALSFLFWILVTRLVDADEVGAASAVISTQTLLGLVGSLGLGTYLVVELPRRPPEEHRGLVLRAFLSVSVVAAAVSLVVALVVRATGGGALAHGLESPCRTAMFLVGAAAAAIVLVLDEAVLGVDRADVQLRRNITASLLRFPLTLVVLLLGVRDATALQALWIVPILLSVLLAWRRLRLPGGATLDVPPPGGVRARGRIGVVVGEAARATRHYGLNLAVAASTQLVPAVAGLVLTSEENAPFAIAWLIATFAFVIPYFVSVALFARRANDHPLELARSMRQTLPVCLGLVLLAEAGAAALGYPVLLVFGPQYAAEGYVLLLLLIPAGIGMVVKDHLVAWWRVREQFRLATTLAVCAVLVEIAGAVVGGVLDDARGVALGWLVGLTVELVVAVPLLVVVVRQGRRAPVVEDAS